MAPELKRQKKGTISQEDVYSVLQRYSVTTVLTLLKEVAQVADVKIDWNELVKKTATGISSAREYQMLWRHLAYRDALEESLDEGTAPLDGDSDLEFELETHPPISSESSTEAAACVKVMIASGSLSDANLGSTVEAPLTINIPSGWSSSAASEKPQLHETNITVPVLVQKQPLPTVSSAEGFDANGLSGGTLPPRRKRKPWSEAEDQELIAAVKKCGEGNWANILKGDFKGDRTASQLSQRWAIIRKRKDNLGVGGDSHELHQAVRRAVHLALDMPMVDNLTATFLNGKVGTNPNSMATPSNSTRPTAVESSQLGTQSKHQAQHDSAPTTSSKPRFMTSKKPSINPPLSPDAMVKAAAVAAGARIATPSDAASLLKAAQSKNAVHIMPGGPTAIKSSVPGNVNSLPPNVHYIRTGLVNRSTSGYNSVSTNASRPSGTHQVQNNVTRPSASMIQINSTQIADESDPTKELVVLGNDPIEQVQKSNANILGNETKENMQDQTSVLHDETNEGAHENQSSLPHLETHLKNENKFVENSECLPSAKIDGGTGVIGIDAENGSEKGRDGKMIGTLTEAERENNSITAITCGYQSLDGKQASDEVKRVLD